MHRFHCAPVLLAVLAAFLLGGSADAQNPIQINCGGPTVAGFAADANFTGGHTFSTTSPISNLGSVPLAVYQTERSGPSFSYDFTGLAPSASYLIQLHFAEIYWQTPGSRMFNVSVNGVRVFTNYDIFTKAGGANIAIVESINATSTSSGAISVTFDATANEAKLSAITLARASGVAQGDSDGDGLLDGVDPYPADAFNGGWQILPSANGSAPTTRHEADCLRLNGQFAIFGGRETSFVEYYDPVSNTWTKSTAAPLYFSHFQAASVNGLVYVIGAMVGSYPDETNVPDIYIFNPISKVWSKGPSIPIDRRRGGAATGVYNGKIYIAGGNTKGHRSGWVSWFDEFDPGTGAWKRLTDAPQPRDHHRACVVQDRMYLVAGRRSSFGAPGGVTGNTVSQIEAYDFPTAKWVTLPNPMPTPRAGVGFIAHGRDLIVIAGENLTGPLPNVEAFDLLTGNWRIFPALKQKRNAPVAAAVGDKLYVTGGQGTGLNNLEVMLLPQRSLSGTVTPPPPPPPPPPPSGGTTTEIVTNGGFESTTPKPTGFLKLLQSAVPGWLTNNPSGRIEVWKTGFLGIPSQSGAQLIELDGFSLEQNLTTTPGAVLSWSFYHRGRQGTDTVALEIGPPGKLVRINTFVTTNTAWVKYEGKYTLPAGQTQTRFALIPVAAAYNAMGAANLIDNVSVLQTVP